MEWRRIFAVTPMRLPVNPGISWNIAGYRGLLCQITHQTTHRGPQPVHIMDEYMLDRA